MRCISSNVHIERQAHPFRPGVYDHGHPKSKSPPCLRKSAETRTGHPHIFFRVPRSCVCVFCRHRAGVLTCFLSSYLFHLSCSRKLRRIIFTSTTVRLEVNLRLKACPGV